MSKHPCGGKCGCHRTSLGYVLLLFYDHYLFTSQGGETNE